MSNKLLDMLKLNPFAPIFADAMDQEEITNKILMTKNSQGVSQEELDYYNDVNGYGFCSEDDISYISFNPIFENKRARVAKYREMARYPEIMDAIENIVNDSMVDNGDGLIAILKFKMKKMPVNMRKRIQNLYDHFVYDIMNFSENAYKWYKKWLVDAELFGELIPNEDGSDLIGIKILPPHTTTPIYDKGRLKGFAQMIDVPVRNMNTFSNNMKNVTPFEPNQIAYASYEDYGENEIDVRGYLESAIKIYNMLKSIEDSIVIYRLVRAPERRVWNIYTGRMPKGKAEEYVKSVMKKYRFKNLYDPVTGAIDSSQNIQALSHDIWFSKDDSGHGTEVDTVGGGMQLGELGDLEWFKEKLYKALHLPTSRWVIDQTQGPYTSGKMGTTSNEEIKFARFIEGLQRKFRYFILKPFMTYLRMKGIPEEYISNKVFDIEFTKSSLFKEYKEIELREARLGILSSVSGFITSRDNVNAPEALFSKEYVLKKFFKMTDEEYEENQELIRKELTKAEDLAKEFPPINPYNPEGLPVGGEQLDQENLDQENLDQENLDQENLDQNNQVDSTKL